MYQNIIGEFKTEYEMRNTFIKTRYYNFKDDIFEIYWKDFLGYANNSNLTIRNVVLSEMDRLLKCKTDELGYSLYKCPNCDNELMVHNTCKCRTCPSCGIKYAKQRTQNIMNHLYNCPHRHITFTIPSTLWNLFRENKKLLNLLFEAVNSTLSRFFSKIKKNENFKDGFILTLHTFGRSNNWNVHIHALVQKWLLGIILHIVKLISFHLIYCVNLFKLPFFLFLKNILVKRNLDLLKIKSILRMIMVSM